tara:strand:- start:182 stop:709 length:528 start_codon:yes stop_codon:yes gene_type:complete
MYYLKTNNSFLYEKILEIKDRLGFPIIIDKVLFQDSYIELIQESSTLKIMNKYDSHQIHLPCQLSLILSKMQDLISKDYLFFGNIHFNPVLQIAKNEKLEITLGDIHNKILYNLFLNLSQGIKREDLYQLIWPIDKNIQINKLDTHITNLKKTLFEGLSYQIKISSNHGFLKIIN